MRKLFLLFALTVGLLTSASTAMAQTVNMSRYITLTVNDGAHISLRFCAAAEGTPVRIVSGSNTQDITVGTSWTSTATYTADGTTMTIYGDIRDFICDDNGANLTSLDPSHNTQLRWLFCENNSLSSLDVSNNTQLKKLWCYNNNFSTAALDDIFCALPDRTGKENGQIKPVYSDTSSNHATVIATNAQNATSKNWKVQYADNTDIPATTGSYTCPQPNMSRYITLTVTNGAAIKLDFKAVADGTPIRIVSGSNTQDITVGTDWKGTASYTAGSTTMTIYGDLTGFNCSENGANLTALDVTKNTQLTSLDCGSNTLSSLDVSKNTQLTGLGCESNNLSSLDISHNTQLTALSCFNNRLSNLDISHNTQLTRLSCRDNKLSNLDISHNTQLTRLYCHGNNFTTAALDDIFCALPVRQASDDARIQPVYSDTSSNHAIVLATNKANATAKNWKVQYWINDADIATTGTYECPQLNMSRYITLTVAKDSAIKLDFMAAAEGTLVRIVSGSNTQDITVGTDWTGTASYTAGSTTMKVYGDITAFRCYQNKANLTALDVSNNTQLEYLDCSENRLSSLDVSKNTQLTLLNCSSNTLSSLDVSKNTQLDMLDCSSNTLSSLDVSQNTQLTGLWCFSNTLSSLDVSKNTQLTRLFCNNNNLSNLDISHNTQLTGLFCHGNNFSTAALDDIYCALPDRTGKENGKIQPVYNSSSSNHTTVLATNAQNAIDKNWKVQYYDDDTDIPTTGKHKCSATDIAEATAEQALTLYPNPVADVLYLSATARTIRIYNVYGIEVAHATDTDRVEVSHLPAGIYTVNADGTVAKMVKR